MKKLLLMTLLIHNSTFFAAHSEAHVSKSFETAKNCLRTAVGGYLLNVIPFWGQYLTYLFLKSDSSKPSHNAPLAIDSEGMLFAGSFFLGSAAGIATWTILPVLGVKYLKNCFDKYVSEKVLQKLAEASRVH